MKMNRTALAETSFWSSNQISLPLYDSQAVRVQTQEKPLWVHFGAGNIFRGFVARLQQKLLNEGLTDTGIIAAETFDFDIIDKIYRPYDNLTLMVGLKPDGSTLNEVIGSVTEAVKADSSDSNDWARLCTVFRQASLQMASFTITEKGYSIHGMDGALNQLVREDVVQGPTKARHAMAVIAALMYERYLAGGFPLALVSMDNCSHNGEKLKTAVLEIAALWVEKGLVQKGFVDYLADEQRVSWPWTMIDKITPRPAEEIEKQLASLGLSGMEPVITSKGTYIAPFVNAEIPEYLVIEDWFPNGRPDLGKAGVYFTDRNTVNLTERMKVTTCLNPLHTALAVFGCLLGYTSISEEMKDSDLKLLVEKIGYSEGMPVVTDPGIIKPEDFIREVINDRLPNPFIPDMPQRIATDTSQKVSIRFGETIKAYIERPDLDPAELRAIPLVLAAWLRYLLAVDDAGAAMEVSSDPMLEEMQAMLADISFGDPESGRGRLGSILNNASIFGTDLVACGLSDRIEDYFCRMLAGPGAVRAVLREVLQDTGV